MVSMEKNSESQGLRIKRLRGEAGLSQSALAATANLTVQAIKDIEAGRRGGSAQSLRSIANALGVSLETVMGEGKDAPKKPAEPAPLPVKAVLAALGSIPSSIVEKATEFGPRDEVWDEVMVVLEARLKELEKQKSKTKRA